MARQNWPSDRANNRAKCCLNMLLGMEAHHTKLARHNMLLSSLKGNQGSFGTIARSLTNLNDVLSLVVGLRIMLFYLVFSDQGVNRWASYFRKQIPSKTLREGIKSFFV